MKKNVVIGVAVWPMATRSSPPVIERRSNVCRTITYLGGLMAAVAMVGCGAPPEEAGNAGVHEGSRSLVGGTVTSARPEIGTFSRGCTATLIAPHYVLTAGHCSGYIDTVSTGDSVTFRDSSGTSHTYTVDRIHNFGSTAASPGGNGAFALTPDNFAMSEGTNDVEILRLSTDVPSSVAVPAQIAGTPPRAGDRVTVFGYGCTERTTKTGSGSKEYFSYNFGTNTQALCPGDSGGPVVFGEVGDGGQIWGTNTGYWGSSSTDVHANDAHGNVSYFKNQIVQLMQAWDATELEVGIDRTGGDYLGFLQLTTNPIECRNACINDSACRAFTSVALGIQGFAAICWLKNTVPNWKPCDNCTSGTRFQQEANIDRPGSDYTSFDLGEARPELCEASCARDSNCQAYTYVVPGVQGPAARCWLKNGVPAANGSWATVSGARRGFENNVDRPGFDYTHFAVAADPRICRDACATDKRCKSFSYVQPGLQGPSAVCWLKSGAPAPGPAAGVTSGMKRGLEVNTDRPGSDFNNFSQSSDVPEECQAACAADSRCLAWTFVPSGVQGIAAHCWLKNGIPRPGTSDGIVSGLKGAEFF